MKALWRRLGLSSWGLRARILALALVPVVVLALLLGTTLIRQRAQDLELQLIERGQLLSRQLAAAADFPVFAGNRAALQALVDAVQTESSVRGAWVLDREGRVLAVAGPSAANPAPPWQPPATAANTTTPTPPLIRRGPDAILFASSIRSPQVLDEEWLEAEGSTRGPRGQSPQALVEVDTTAVRAEIRFFVGVVFSLMGFVLLGSWWVARRLSERLVRPVNEVASAVQQLALGQSRVRVQSSSGILMLDGLASGFNTMAEQLERSRGELEDRVRQATRDLQAEKEAAERADQAKTRFLAAASHDLRQPMHALSMFVTALELEGDPIRRDELLARISTATQAMGDLLDSLLDMSKLDAGAVQAQLTSVAIKPLLVRLHTTYRELAANRDIELVLRARTCWVLSDAVLLERMLGNLLSNAIRYTPANGHGKVMIAVRPQGREIRIEIRDNGPGIPDHQQDAVFEEFIQLDNPERDRSKGLGLGLAIVRRLGRILGHPVRLRSRVGVGSVFSISLPLTSAPRLPEGATPQAGQAMLPRAARTLQGRRVLVVDDDALVRESLSQVVMLWGAEVLESSGDGDVVASLEQAQWWPHLVLTDYRLRGPTDGLSLLTRIQSAAQAQGHTVQGVLITGETEQSAIRRSERADLRVLFKPVRAPALRQVVDELTAAAASTRR